MKTHSDISPSDNNIDPVHLATEIFNNVDGKHDDQYVWVASNYLMAVAYMELNNTLAKFKEMLATWRDISSADTSSPEKAVLVCNDSYISNPNCGMIAVAYPYTSAYTNHVTWLVNSNKHDGMDPCAFTPTKWKPL